MTSTHPDNQPPFRLTREELLSLHASTCAKARLLMANKNADYSGGDADCFGNFRAAEMLGVHPVIGLLMRCGDKFQRIRSFVNSGTLAVKGESVNDAIEDVINYMILLKGMIVEQQQDVANLQACNSEAVGQGPVQPACSLDEREEASQLASQILFSGREIPAVSRHMLLMALHHPALISRDQYNIIKSF